MSMIGVLFLSLAVGVMPLAQAEEPVERPTSLSEYSVEVGTYPTYRQARDIRNLLNRLAPARVDSIEDPKGGRNYRVLVGQFRSLRQADGFIADNRLKKLFGDRWVNAIRTDHADVQPDQNVRKPGDPEPQEAEPTDPYQLTAQLNCEGTRQGEYKAQFKPDPAVKGSEVTVKVQWECVMKNPLKPEEEKKVADAPPVKPVETAAQEGLPSYFALSAVGGYTTISANTPTIGSVSPGGLVYGAEASAYYNLWKGIGPILDYRFVARRTQAGSL